MCPNLFRKMCTLPCKAYAPLLVHLLEIFYLFWLIIFSTRRESVSNGADASNSGAVGASTSPFISLSGVGNDCNKVFLSFRGTDAHTGFTNHLYHSQTCRCRHCASSCSEMIKTSKSARSLGQSFSAQSCSLRSRYRLSLPIILPINGVFASSFKWWSRETEESLADVLQSRSLTCAVPEREFSQGLPLTQKAFWCEGCQARAASSPGSEFLIQMGIRKNR